MRFPSALARVSGAIVLAAAIVIPAAAQTPAPGITQPGQIERQFQAPPEPRAKPGAITVPAPVDAAPSGAESARLTPARIVVSGATVYPDATIRAFFGPLENTPTTLAAIIAAANALTTKYRNDGYILAQVVLPEQRIAPDDQVVQVQVFEGFIDAVRFSGDVDGDATRLDAIGERIRAARPLSATVLERYLLLANDTPGIRAATTLVPSAARTGAADLEIRITRERIGAAIAIDNRGSRAVGPLRTTADLDVAGLTGTSRTAAKLVSTLDRELGFASLVHEQFIGDEGTKIVASGSAARSRPDLGATFGALGYATDSGSLALGVAHPLYRSRAENLYVRATLTGYDGHTLVSGTRVAQDRIRALRLGLTWDLADEWLGVNIVDAELAQGLDVAGATGRDDPNRSRANGRSDFTKATLYAARLQSIARRWSLLTAVSGQYAWSDLLSPELYGVGGEAFGRGYDPAEILGDYGAAAKLELRFTDTTSLAWLPRYTVYAFYDFGFARRRTPTNEPAQASLASTGVGLRFGADRRLSGFVELAQPLTRTVLTRGDRDLHVYAGLAWRM